MRVNLTVNGRTREADDVREVVTVEGLAAHAGQRVAYGGRDTGTVVGENGSGSGSCTGYEKIPDAVRPAAARRARREHEGLQERAV
ncbi:hypothetical protein OG247_27635 [Streptomyces sp. NBC_01244]|nr:hypothetical protein OG247_27635 [Streptomyces sp. NBC_01244]